MKKQIIKLTAALVLLLSAITVKVLWNIHEIYLSLFFLSFIICGLPVVISAARGIFSGKLFDECFLMSLASIGAFCIGEYAEGVAIMLFYQVGELFCDSAADKSRDGISALMQIRSDEAFVKRGSEIIKVHPSKVAVGEIIVVSAGQRVPVDGTICEGSTSFDTSSLTGEALPRDAAEGDKAISGFINLSGTVSIKTESTFEGSTASKILQLIEKNAEKKSKAEHFITRFARKYTPAVVIIAALIAFVPPLFLGAAFSECIYRALSFLVVSCPCALVISVPVAFFGGIGAAARHGVLIKGSNIIDSLAKADKIIFDKTGTLTDGSFELRKIHAQGMTQKELFALVVSAEHFSSHPISVFLKSAFGKEPNLEKISDVKEYSGYGVSATVDGKSVFVGNGKLMKREGVEAEEVTGGCVLHVAVDKSYAGYLVISDRVRPTAKSAVSKLRELGVKYIAMLTGDTVQAAQRTAQETGIENFSANLLPAEKTEHIEEKLCDNPLIFVGDGINDAPAIARADIGCAMGALGSEAAIEAADVVLMNDNPEAVASAIEISRGTIAIAKQNIIFSLVIKAAVMLLCGIAGADLWFAVFADVGVCIIAVLNSLRALRF